MGNRSSSSSEAEGGAEEKTEWVSVKKVRRRPVGYKPTILEQTLMDACEMGKLEKVRQIAATAPKVLKKQLRIECENAIGSTPLKLACREGHVEIARLLLDRFQADINNTGGVLNGAEYFYGGALYQAVKNNHMQCVCELLSRDHCDINQLTDEHEITALMCAVRRGYSRMTSYLLHVSMPDHYADDWHSAAHRPADKQKHTLPPRFGYLQAFGIAPNCASEHKPADGSSDGAVAVSESAIESHLKTESKPKASKWSKLKPSVSLSLPRSLAFWESSAQRVASKGRRGVDFPSRDIETERFEASQGLNVMHSCAWHNSDDRVMRPLLAFGVDPNQKIRESTVGPHSGDFPLHRLLTGWMVSAEKKPLKTDTFLCFGANPLLRNASEQLPIDKALGERIDPSVVVLLLKGMQDFSEKKPYLMFS